MPKYKNNQSVQIQDLGVIFAAGATKETNKILVELILKVSTDAGIQVGDKVTGGTSGADGRVLRIIPSGTAGTNWLHLVEWDGNAFTAAETITGDISTDTAVVVSSQVRLTRLAAGPYYNPKSNAVTLTAGGAEDEIMYPNVDTTRALKVNPPTAGNITVYFRSKTANLPAVITGLASTDTAAIVVAVNQDVDKVIVSFSTAASAIIEEFRSLAEAQALAAV